MRERNDMMRDCSTMMRAVRKAVRRLPVLGWRTACYGAVGMLLIGGYDGGSRRVLLASSAFAVPSSPHAHSARITRGAKHQRKAAASHHAENVANSETLGQMHIKPGDPLLDELPAGWGVHVLGVGGPQGGKAPKESSTHSVKKVVRPPHTIQPAEVTATKPEGHPAAAGAVGLAAGVGDASVPSQAVGHIPAATASSRNRILIPVPGQMGIAAYQSGDRLIILVDGRHPMDIAALRGDGMFAQLSVTALPDVTMITLPVPDTRALYLSQQSNGWVLGDQPPPAVDYTDRREISPTLREDGLYFPMRKPGRVFSVEDPVSNTPLLVGTTVLDDGGMLSLRRGVDYDVWPSLEGIVIAQHDPPQVTMKAVAKGDLLQRADGRPLSDLDRAIYASDVDLNWLGLKNLTPAQARERYRHALIAAADSTPGERFKKRFEAAQAALGVGIFPEARAIMDVALEDDPEEAFRPDVRFFLAATDLLTGQMKGASQLMQQWPEQAIRATKLWQGLYEALAGGKDSEAAHLLARDMPRLMNYPEPLRSFLLPIAAETIARHGGPAEWHALDHLPEGSAYQFAKAVRALRSGREDEAIHLLEDLSVDKDPIVAEKAMEEGIALSVRDGHIDSEKAARQYASLLPDARLAGRDGVVNMLRAGANIRAKKWEAALQALNQVEDTPLQQDPARIQVLLGKALTGLMQDLPHGASAGQSPQDEAALVRGAALMRAYLPDLLPSDQKGTLQLSYGQLLGRLGLADKAGEAMTTAIPMITDPQKRAAGGDMLAENEIKRGLFDEASATLAQTAPNPMPPQEAAERNRIMARMAAASGKPEIALYLLSADQSSQGADMRARLHENREEWPAAIADLRGMVEHDLPEQGALDVPQQLLALRFASDASRAGDVGMLNWIKNRVGERPFEGDAGRMFQLLVSPEQD